MTQKTTHRQTSSSSAVPVVLYGLDEHGKPKAARFPEKQADLATKAAGLLKLQVLPIVGASITDLAGRVPAGRIHANGRGFVPYIRRDLYDKLVVAAVSSSSSSARPLPDNVAATSAANPPRSEQNATGNRPRNWDAIDTGHVVVAQEDTPSDGWYEAIILERNGDMFTLQWREYPRQRRVTRHRLSLALLYPNGAYSEPSNTPTTQAGNSSAQKKNEKASVAADRSGPRAEGAFPTNWEEIDIGCLVLAKEDGPSRTWWEAIPTEKSGNSFTLRWRDYPQVPNVGRPRFSLALLCPRTK
jgi:hypothetical protein